MAMQAGVQGNPQADPQAAGMPDQTGQTAQQLE
jgi:hypothetical protein